MRSPWGTRRDSKKRRAALESSPWWNPREEFRKPLGMSAYELVKRLHVPVPRVNDIVVKRRGISADTAVRLSRFFGTREQFWLNLQGAYEVSSVLAEETTAIERIEPRALSASR